MNKRCPWWHLHVNIDRFHFPGQTWRWEFYASPIASIIWLFEKRRTLQTSSTQWGGGKGRINLSILGGNIVGAEKTKNQGCWNAIILVCFCAWHFECFSDVMAPFVRFPAVCKVSQYICMQLKHECNERWQRLMQEVNSHPSMPAI